MAEYTLPCSQADYDKLHTHIPDLHEKGVEDKMSHVARHVEKMSRGINRLHKTMSLTGDADLKLPAGKDDAADLPAMEKLMSRATLLMSRPEPAPSPIPLKSTELHYAGKSLAGARQQAIDAGLTPASVDALMGRLMQHPRELGTLTMSRAVQEGDELFMREAANCIDVLECLAKNPPTPVSLGQSKTFMMSRQVPGAPPEPETPPKPENPLLKTAQQMSGTAA